MSSSERASDAPSVALVEEICKRIHLKHYTGGQSYYSWDRMAPSYREQQRETVSMALEEYDAIRAEEADRA